MGRWGELTPATINQIAWEVREGNADPEDARRLLELFCESGDRIPRELLSHFCEAFRAYLGGKKTLDSALGLARKRGRPGADEERQQMLAVEVLRHRLAGLSSEDAIAKVAEDSVSLLTTWGYKARGLGGSGALYNQLYNR